MGAAYKSYKSYESYKSSKTYKSYKWLYLSVIFGAVATDLMMWAKHYILLESVELLFMFISFQQF